MQNYKNIQIDLTNCDKEPIHIIGSTQPHGFLLILSKETLTIEQVSENVEQFLFIGPHELIGKSIGTFLSSEEHETILNQLKNKDKASTQVIHIQGLPFFTFIHQSAHKIILECEPYIGSIDKERLAYNQLIVEFQHRLHSLDTLEDLSNTVTDFIHSFLGYDRVLIFRFDEEWHAEVIAESRKPDVHSFAGHYFPATDIPVPARALLEKKQVRQIPDVKAKSVEIIPYENPSTGLPTDILQSELRYPSQMHIQYLKNMDVYASFSISILMKGKLWGLVSCSNHTPTFTNFWKRQVCQMVTNIYANMILSIQEKTDALVMGQYERTEEILVERINTMGDISKALFTDSPNLLDITESEGAALFLGNQLVTIGKTPSERDILDILEWLAINNTGRIFYTRSLSKYIDRAQQYRKQASGLLALEVSRYTKEYILFFKPEIKQARMWAGNPQKPVLISGQDLQVHPRKSFEKWVEEIKGKSLPRTLNELEIAQTLKKDITAIQLRNQAFALEQAHKDVHAKVEELRLRNHQMEDFARIMSHNLRSPINSMNGLYAIYQEDPTPENASFVMEQIHVLSNNLLSTIADLNTILQTKVGQGLKEEKVNLTEIIEKELQNLKLTVDQLGAEIVIELAVIHLIIPKVYLESIIHNFVSNALKYHSDKRKPSLQIKSWLDTEHLYLSFSDNGIGMDLNKVGNKLFGLYKTFHRNRSIDSKGMGLYLTKMQIESLGGEIMVESELDKGTTFTIKFKLARKEREKPLVKGTA